MMLQWWQQDCGVLIPWGNCTALVTNRFHHKHFVNAQYCCNHDPAVFNYICDDREADAYSIAAPHCPPVVTFQCASLQSQECNQVMGAAGVISHQTAF